MTACRKIAVVTGSRAEYGHLKWLIQDLSAISQVDLQVVVSGSHLSPHHGLTVTEIEGDGVAIAVRVDMLMAGDTSVAVAKSIGLGTIGFADAFDRLHPDLVVILGDRYEALAAAQAAMILRLPIAHIHGGETTEGVIDEAIRHSITKMAQLHFVAAEPYRQRVIQMGEDPRRVFCLGAPGLDHLNRTPLLDRVALESLLGIALDRPLLLVTYHPETLSDQDQGAAARELVEALIRFDNANIIITGVNADPSGAAVSQVLRSFAKALPERVRVFESLGYQGYLSLVRLASVVIGNSSSGIIEVPALQVPSVNIGTRQQGRLRAASVIDCGSGRDDIASAITRALSADFLAVAATVLPPYGRGDASRRIAEVLSTHPLNNLLMKKFHDLPYM